MKGIYEINSNFDYGQLSLANPTPVQGGSYFTKLSIGDKNNLLVQMPKCKTKTGIVKSGKKYYCDLLFSSADDNLVVQWFEQLEDKCRDLICEKKDIWFQDDLDDNDIESMLSSSMRLYKSGKYILVRVFIMKDPHKNEPDNIKCMIYDENEQIKTLDDINSEQYVIPLIWLNGIKFTSKEFKLEINLNQVMILDDTPIFDTNCQIKRNLNTMPSLSQPETNPIADQLESAVAVIATEDPVAKAEPNDALAEPQTEPSVTKETLDNENEFAKSDILPNVNETENTTSENSRETLAQNDEVGQDLEEINVNCQNTENELVLKKPTEVYIEIYQAARLKAKKLKTAALDAFLEAKQIKSKYMLDDLDIDTSDDESEIDHSLGNN